MRKRLPWLGVAIVVRGEEVGQVWDVLAGKKWTCTRSIKGGRMGVTLQGSGVHRQLWGEDGAMVPSTAEIECLQSSQVGDLLR